MARARFLAVEAARDAISCAPPAPATSAAWARSSERYHPHLLGRAMAILGYRPDAEDTVHGPSSRRWSAWASSASPCRSGRLAARRPPQPMLDGVKDARAMRRCEPSGGLAGGRSWMSANRRSHRQPAVRARLGVECGSPASRTEPDRDAAALLRQLRILRGDRRYLWRAGRHRPYGCSTARPGSPTRCLPKPAWSSLTGAGAASVSVRLVPGTVLAWPV